MNLSSPEWSWIADDSALAAFCSGPPPETYALDTEFYHRRTFYPVPCLIQLAHAGGCGLIDPRAEIADWGPLQRWLNGPGLCLMHAADEDLRILSAVSGALPTHLVDTQAAAPLIGERFQVGLAPVVEKFLQLEMSKSERDFDWRTRPLSESHQRYAALDALLLLPLWDRLHGELGAIDRLDWALEEGARILALASEPRPPRLPRRSGRRGEMAPTNPLIQALSEARLQVAQRRDIPQPWVMSDDRLMQIARSAPRDAKALGALLGKDQKDQRMRMKAGQIWGRSRRADVQSERPPYMPGHKLRYERLKAWRQQCAAELSIEASFIATNSQLLHYACHRRMPPPLDSGWRREQFGSGAEALDLKW
ncbi:MAG: HRDC domain-containing protein [Gammaproteobacteria bacterium AqS3]|nr:HRDC domain-containing protein [Gammaproteobacteria bacterium AqS3]